VAEFVNYTEGDEHKRVCIHCFEIFDVRKSKREEHCSRYCAKTYERKIYGITGEDPVAESR